MTIIFSREVMGCNTRIHEKIKRENKMPSIQSFGRSSYIFCETSSLRVSRQKKAKPHGHPSPENLSHSIISTPRTFLFPHMIYYLFLKKGKHSLFRESAQEKTKANLRLAEVFFGITILAIMLRSTVVKLQEQHHQRRLSLLHSLCWPGWHSRRFTFGSISTLQQHGRHHNPTTLAITMNHPSSSNVKWSASTSFCSYNHRFSPCRRATGHHIRSLSFSMARADTIAQFQDRFFSFNQNRAMSSNDGALAAAKLYYDSDDIDSKELDDNAACLEKLVTRDLVTSSDANELGNDEENDNSSNGEEGPKTEQRSKYLSFKKYTLREMCRKRCLKVGGTKAELMERLLSSESKLEDNRESENNISRPATTERPSPINGYGFDESNNYTLVPWSETENVIGTPNLEIVDEINSLLELIPPQYRSVFEEHTELRRNISEVVIDVGRRPYAWINRERVFLSEDEVEPDVLMAVLKNLKFGSDNRAGVYGQLHRISAIRNRDGQFVGATLRVGRYIPGNSMMIADILLGQRGLSVLFVGPPGSAKTSIIRDVARLMSQKRSVAIVDTSNEIGGSGDVPHKCIGLARRLQVSTLDKQAAVMVECVQNHTPEIMIIDEIGRPEEVAAALTCRERGVRMIASAHGDLIGLTRNKALRGLMGGVAEVIVGDRTAKKDAQRHGKDGIARKLRPERRGPPIFDVIVELQSGNLHEWRIVLNSATAVDSILAQGKYEAQIRARTPNMGPVRITEIIRSVDQDDILVVQEGLNC